LTHSYNNSFFFNYDSLLLCFSDSTSNREEKWNELDNMLGAQSALLSRLESDFVANRSKLKSSANSNANTKSSYLQSALGSAAASKYQPVGESGSSSKPASKKPLKYASSKTERLATSGRVDVDVNAESQFQRPETVNPGLITI
jgi:hypothetical protein